MPLPAIWCSASPWRAPTCPRGGVAGNRNHAEPPPRSAAPDRWERHGCCSEPGRADSAPLSRPTRRAACAARSSSARLAGRAPRALTGRGAHRACRARPAEIACRELHQPACGQIDGHRVVGGLGAGTVGGRMVLDAQLRGIHQYPQVAVVEAVVVLEHDLIGAVAGTLQDLRGTQRRLPGPGERHEVVAAVAAHEVGDLLAAGARTGETLVVVDVPREHRVRPYADAGADGIDLRLHVHAPAVRAAG